MRQPVPRARAQVCQRYMLGNANRFYILAIAVLMLAGAELLVAFNASIPGFCPAYPYLGVPACIVVAAYFLSIVLSVFLRGLGRLLFYLPAIAAFATGCYFSFHEVVEAGQQCPQLFGIPLPLCFTVPPASALMLYLALRGRIKRYRS